MRNLKHLALPLSAALMLAAAIRAQTMQSPDISKDPTLFVVPYAHLDTQWRWEFPQTISEYLLKTMRVNFDYIDKYPHYVFNWTGANRYRLMKEYFPADYARVKQYVAAGRWFPAGSSMEEGDVNLPSAEGIIRQILYGNTYFRKEFGKASTEYMLPDCFGFPASLPSILAHAGVKGFSTQKLSAAWQPAPKVGGEDSPEQTPEGIPFNVGIWIGTDGKHRDRRAESRQLRQQCLYRSQQASWTAASSAAINRGAARPAHAPAITRDRDSAAARAGLGQSRRPRRKSHWRLCRLSLRRHRATPAAQPRNRA